MQAALLLLSLGIVGAAVISRRPGVRRLRAQACTALAGDGGIDAYVPPSWLPKYAQMVPSRRLRLAHLPTPLHRWPLPRVPAGTEVFIRRDDCTGCELSGNKIRKLEFLLAEALEGG